VAIADQSQSHDTGGGLRAVAGVAANVKFLALMMNAGMMRNLDKQEKRIFSSHRFGKIESMDRGDAVVATAIK